MECTCCRCGKTFNYEKYYGICPKCAAYNRQPGMEQEDFDVEHDISAKFNMEDDDSCARLHEQYDSAPSHRPHEQHMTYHKTYDGGNVHKQNMQSYGTQAYGTKTYGMQNDGSVSEKKNGRKWIWLILIVIFIGIFAGMLYSMNRKRQDIFGKSVMTEAPEQVTVTEISEPGLSVRADAVFDLGTDSELSFVPQFERLIAVHITVTNDNYQGGGDLGAPLVECDGVYRTPLGETRFTQDMLAEIGNREFTEHMLSEYIYTLENNAGYFFYFIPEDAMDTENALNIIFEKYKSEDSDEVEMQYLFTFSEMQEADSGSEG